MHNNDRCVCPECFLIRRESAPRPPKVTGKRAAWLRNELARVAREAQALADADAEQERFRDWSDFWLDCDCWRCACANEVRGGVDAYCSRTQYRFACELARR
jgi:hypothetical protein